MSISDYAENKVLDAIFNSSTTGGGLPTTDPWIQLHSGDPGEAGTTNVVSVARVQAAFPAAASGNLANSANVDFVTMPAVGPLPAGVQAWSVWDAAGSGLPPTGGNCLWTGWFSTVSGEAIVRAGSDVTNNDIQSQGHGLATDDRVVIEAVENFTIPAGLTAGTLYFVLATGLTTDAYRVATTSGGAAIDITAAGQALWRKVVVKATNSGDTFRIAASALTAFLD